MVGWEKFMQMVSICGSRKSESGLAGKPSATRKLGAVAKSALTRIVGPIKDFDLANLTLPFFEGLSLCDYADQALTSFYDAIAQSDAILLQAPAYWQGPSGVVKNLLDLLGGSAYDHLPETLTILSGKQVALMVIGAQNGDAACAELWLRNTVSSLGGQPLQTSFSLDNPRLHDFEKIVRAAWEFGINVGQELTL
jgi:NAD(P)H-dependent FMN reductase